MHITGTSFNLSTKEEIHKMNCSESVTLTSRKCYYSSRSCSVRGLIDLTFPMRICMQWGRSQDSNGLNCPSRSSSKRIMRHYFDRNCTSHSSVCASQARALRSCTIHSQSQLVALVPVGDKSYFLLATWETLTASLLSTVVLVIIFGM